MQQLFLKYAGVFQEPGGGPGLRRVNWDKCASLVLFRKICMYEQKITFLKVFPDSLPQNICRLYIFKIYSFMMNPALIFYSKAPWINKCLHFSAKCKSMKNSSHIGQHQTSNLMCGGERVRSMQQSADPTFRLGAMQLCCDPNSDSLPLLYYKC